MAPDGWKVCSVCGYTKPLGDFYADWRQPDKHRKDCKACVGQAVKDFYKSDPTVSAAIGSPDELDC